MKYQMFSIAIIASVSIASVAQETIRVTNLAPAQDERIETVTTTRRVVPATVASSQAAITGNSESTSVVIQPEYTKQPTTVIEAAPLKTSRAEEMRRVREQSEIETEQKIVEKLEQSRMDAERQRQAAIMGSLNGGVQQADNTNANTNNNTMTVVAPSAAVVMAQPQGQPVVAQPQQPALIQPQQVVIQPQPAVPANTAAQADGQVAKDVVAGAVVTNGILDDFLGERISRTYIRGVVGTIDYDSADIRTVGSFGGALGKSFGDEWSAEITILNSNAYIQDTYSLYRELHQLDIGLAAQYSFLVGRFRPYVGFLVDYVMREYSDVQYAFGPYVNAQSQIESWALDYGFSGGVDLILNRHFQLGIEYRYMTNLTYEYNQTVMNTPAYQASPYSSWIPLEERDSSFLGFSIKYVY